MATVDQHRFLSRVRRALGHPRAAKRRLADRLRPHDPDPLRARAKKIAERSRRQRLDLLDILAVRCRQSNIGIHIEADPQGAVRRMAALVISRCGESDDARQVILWRHPLLERLNPTMQLAAAGVKAFMSPIRPDRAVPDTAAEDRQRARFRSQVVSAAIGITSADYCLADSATLVMTTGSGRPRAVSLVPPVHIAVITLREILRDLQELYALLSDSVHGAGREISNCMTLVSGPSATRDIEAVPVAGAQGPRELHIVVISRYAA